MQTATRVPLRLSLQQSPHKQTLANIEPRPAPALHSPLAMWQAKDCCHSVSYDNLSLPLRFLLLLSIHSLKQEASMLRHAFSMWQGMGGCIDPVSLSLQAALFIHMAPSLPTLASS